MNTYGTRDKKEERRLGRKKEKPSLKSRTKRVKPKDERLNWCLVLKRGLLLLGFLVGLVGATMVSYRLGSKTLEICGRWA